MENHEIARNSASSIGTKNAENHEITQKPTRPITPVDSGEMSCGIFSSTAAFQNAMQMAGTLAKSTIVPKEYQTSASNPNGYANCLIALEMSKRLNTSPMMVMQNLYVVNGRPAWSSQYIMAVINNSKKYKTELQFDLKGSGDNMSCYAWVEDYNGHKVVGPTITMAMAKAEGWVSKNGSKWQTMPEVMIRYRAASFFGRLNCPDLVMGIYSRDEVIEGDFTVNEAVPNGQEIAMPEERAAVSDTVNDTSTEEPDF